MVASTVQQDEPEHGALYDLSIVVPAHNEADHIAATLDGLEQAFEDWDIELIVVDDGSTDATASEVRRWHDRHADHTVQLITLTPNQGKGGALCRGTAAARGAWVAWIDADGDIAPGELVPLVQQAQQHGSIVVGNKQCQVWQTAGVPRWRKLVSRSFAKLVKTLYHLPINDTQTGCKVFPGAWIRRTVGDVQAVGFLLDLEVLARAHLAAVPMAEHPITVKPQRTVNRIGARHMVRSMAELLALHWRMRLLHREARQGGHGADLHA